MTYFYIMKRTNYIILYWTLESLYKGTQLHGCPGFYYRRRINEFKLVIIISFKKIIKDTTEQDKNS